MAFVKSVVLTILSGNNAVNKLYRTQTEFTGKRKLEKDLNKRNKSSTFAPPHPRSSAEILKFNAVTSVAYQLLFPLFVLPFLLAR